MHSQVCLGVWPPTPTPLFHSHHSFSAAALRTLNLRQNILTDASDLNSAAFKSNLVDLELRDNLLKEVCMLDAAVGCLGAEGTFTLHCLSPVVCSCQAYRASRPSPG